MVPRPLGSVIWHNHWRTCGHKLYIRHISCCIQLYTNGGACRSIVKGIHAPRWQELLTNFQPIGLPDISLISNINEWDSVSWGRMTIEASNNGNTPLRVYKHLYSKLSDHTPRSGKVCKWYIRGALLDIKNLCMCLSQLLTERYNGQMQRECRLYEAQMERAAVGQLTGHRLQGGPRRNLHRGWHCHVSG